MICGTLTWSFDAVTKVPWLEIIKAAAPVVTAIIAYTALRNWQRQDKAKREAEFLDALIEATHSYLVQTWPLIARLEFAKLGFLAHMPDDGDDRAIRGAIGYIRRRGEEESARFKEALEVARPAQVRLGSLASKGEIFGFPDYGKCSDGVARLTAQFRRIEAFAVILASVNVNWEDEGVRRALVNANALNPADVRQILDESDRAVLDFAADTYRRLYGQTR